MQTTKKILSLLLALVMVLGVAAPAFAVEEPTETTVVIHKMEMTSLEGWPKDYDDIVGEDGKPKYDGSQIGNLEDYFGTGAKELAGVTFYVYEITDAETYATMVKESVNYDTKAKVDALGDTKATLKETVVTTKDGVDVTLGKGNFWFVEDKTSNIGTSTLSGAAAVPFGLTLPMARPDGTYFGTTVEPDNRLHVYPKNTVTGEPTVDKKEDTSNADVPETGGNVTVGQKVPYIVTTKIEAGSTYKEVSWNDRMSKGLTFDENVTISSNPDLGLTTDDYSLDYTDNGFVLRLKNTGLIKLGKVTAPNPAVYQIDEQDVAGENKEVNFTLKYTATVNDDALVDNALENTVTFHYGNNPGFKPLPGDKNPVPETGKTQIDVSKSFVSGDDMGTSEAWPANMSIVLKLQVYDPTNNSWSDVTGEGGTLTLTSGKTTGSFTGLDKNKTYRVVEESVSGWVPNYSIDPEDGKLVINNRKNENPEPITPEPVIVRTGGHRFQKVKKDGTGLAGAEFVVKNGEGKFLKEKDAAKKQFEQATYAAAEKAYKDAVKENTKTEEEIKALKEARDEAYRKVQTQWEFTGTKEDEGYKFIADQDGYFKVTGLTYGSYQLIETKAPNGFAKRTEPVDFTVSANSMEETKLEADKLTDSGLIKIENTELTIPQTGGIGTVIFTVGGLALMGGAGYALKKSKEDDEE